MSTRHHARSTYFNYFPITVETICAATQRISRVEVSHLKIERRNISIGDIGWIGDNKPRPGNGISGVVPATLNEFDPV
mgnify:CR=1 FL=1